MKKHITAKQRKPSAGSRIVASLKEAVDWVEGKDVRVRVTKVEVPMIDVRATRRRLGLSQAAFAANARKGRLRRPVSLPQRIRSSTTAWWRCSCSSRSILLP